jgi:hypothetical protein
MSDAGGKPIIRVPETVHPVSARGLVSSQLTRTRLILHSFARANHRDRALSVSRRCMSKPCTLAPKTRERESNTRASCIRFARYSAVREGEHFLAKVGVEGSNPFARSSVFRKSTAWFPVPLAPFTRTAHQPPVANNPDRASHRRVEWFANRDGPGAARLPRSARLSSPSRSRPCDGGHAA